MKCEYFGQCNSKTDGSTECVCPKCGDVFAPVCDSEDRNHASVCHMERYICLNKKKLEISKTEHCGKNFD